MRILLDECVPARLGRFLSEHSIISATRRGWAGIKNGQLLTVAEKGFDAFITVDRKIPLEQDLEKFEIALVLIRARSSRLEALRPLILQLIDASRIATPGKLTVVEQG